MRKRKQHFGFTITELVVVSVIMTTALLGVYSIFKQVLEVDAQATTRWDNYSAAKVILDELADTLEGCVNIPKMKTLVGTSNSDNSGYILTCFVEGKGYVSGQMDQVGFERRQYSWTFHSGDSGAGTVSLKTMDYAGPVNITPISGISELSETEIWERLTERVIAKGLSAITIQFKSTESSDAQWQDTWNGAVGKVAVRIAVTVGDQTVERIVVPQVNAETASKEESS
jgi:hypothetical protein